MIRLVEHVACKIRVVEQVTYVVSQVKDKLRYIIN